MEQVDSAKDITSELESFREQWKREVQARQPVAPEPRQQNHHSESSTAIRRASRPGPERPSHLSSEKPIVAPETDEVYVQGQAFDEPETSESTAQAPDGNDKGEPITALEHYEKAVERETQGALGDSLRLYRKAFRMDHKVDQKYKNKHFAAAWAPKSTQANQPSTTGSDIQKAVVTTAETKPLTSQELIAGFSQLSIEPAAPIIANTPAPPCPIASLPDEILIHILQDVAVADVADFVRLALVCKRFAWLVATEDRIWRRICLGSEFGFAGMHYRWQMSPAWGPITEDRQLDEEDFDEINRLREEEAFATTSLLLNTAYQSSWQQMFKRRPRIRFNGTYISTINYIRAGQAVNTISWNSPVHIVTYYRYTRFYRDGTAITLCTTEEPANVVHHITKDALARHQGGLMAHLPSAMMQYARRARWRLSSAADNPEASLVDSEGDLFVESDSGGNDVYRMELSMRGTAKAARNRKLAWKGFYCLNKRTGEWDELSFKNDRPFLFSRVKSYSFDG